MEILHPHPLVVDDERALAGRVLGGDADRTAVGVAALRLDAADREHEAARGIAPVRAERHGARDVEARHDLAGSAELDAVAGTDPDQRIVDEAQALAHRHAEMVEELERRRAGAALLAVDDDEIRIDAGLQHRLAQRQEFPGVPDAELEARRLAAGQAAHFRNEMHHLDRRRETRMGRRRDAVAAHRYAAGRGDLRRDFRRRQHAAMAGLGALAHLELDHLDLVERSGLREVLRRECAVGVACTEIAGADLPDEVAAVLAMIGAQAALAGVVGEIPGPGSLVERADGIGAERTEAHRRDVEHRGAVGLRAIGPADGDAERLDGVRPRRHRMAHPLEACGVDVVLGAERPLVEHHLGTLIDHRALVAGERHARLLVLEEVLPHLRPHVLQEEAQMGRYRIVAQHRMAGLQQVVSTEDSEEAEHQQRRGDEMDPRGYRGQDEQQCRGEQDGQRVEDEARRKCQGQHAHHCRLPIACRFEAPAFSM